MIHVTEAMGNRRERSRHGAGASVPIRSHMRRPQDVTRVAAMYQLDAHSPTLVRT